MAAPYLVEIRTGGETKSTLRSLISDVETEFAVDGPRSHVVPHVPLFGQYDTDEGPAVKRAIIDTLSTFDIVPYRIAGFGAFEDETVYADVIPSVELVSLRHRLSEELQPVTFDYPPHDRNEHFEFHIPVIEGDRIRGDSAAVLDYLREQSELCIDEYATRITSLSGDGMLWEYDILQGRVLDRDEATSRGSWRRTETLLDERATATDHESLVTEAVGNAIESLRKKGWRYYPDPHSYVTERARADGLYPTNRSVHRRELYLGDNYAYLAFASTPGSESVHVVSIEKDDFYQNTVEKACPFCEHSIRRHGGERLLPCHNCSFQYGLDNTRPDTDAISSASDPILCTRCKRPIVSEAIQFREYVYCGDCVDVFEHVSEKGVVVRSRHEDDEYDEVPYVVYWDGTAHPEDSQVAALARGKELADENGVGGLFVYQRTGSHWLFDTYLDTHPDIAAQVREKRRKIRGENRVQFDEKPIPESQPRDPDPGSERYDIRAGGDVFIADTVVNDAVINRSDIRNEE